MKKPLAVLESSFFSYGLKILTFAGQPQISKCLKLGFLLVHSLKSVFGTALLGTLFNKYMAVFKAYIHNDIGTDELLNILLTIVQKLLKLEMLGLLKMVKLVGVKYHAMW